MFGRNSQFIKEHSTLVYSAKLEMFHMNLKSGGVYIIKNKKKDKNSHYDIFKITNV